MVIVRVTIGKNPADITYRCLSCGAAWALGNGGGQ
jgi:hypothetical protein